MSIKEIGLIPAPHASILEETVINAVEWLKLGVETLGALVIALGVVVACYAFIKALWRRDNSDFQDVRFTLARYLALALEFQIGADILATAIAPSWNQIGQLGAIAVIRTFLNFFLMREMAEVQRKQEQSR
ncbi:DUF1622 domain-containing protein [Candidatus Venteria ishoeyi]|nr:DUF1622 domain-containing protein [Candidatus Venteria ishoeyi]